MTQQSKPSFSQQLKMFISIGKSLASSYVGWTILIALGVGLLLGWFLLGWVIAPVQYTDAKLSSLSDQYQQVHLSYVADSFAAGNTKIEDLARRLGEGWTKQQVIAQLDEMIKAGFAAAAVALTGHPDLERQCRMPVPAEPEARNSCLRDVGLNDHALLLCFFSDPFFIGPDRKYYSGPGAIMNADGTGLFGYTVCDILPEVIQELEAALQTAGAQALLIVKPHPSEDATVLKELLAAARTSHLQLRLGDTASAAECIHRADAFFGMMTIALLQAALAGKPAVSVELGLLESGQEDPCMSNSLGHTLGVFDRAALQTACRAVAQRDWPALRTRPRHELPLIGAARRVVSVLRGMQPFQPDHCRRP